MLNQVCWADDFICLFTWWYCIINRKLLIIIFKNYITFYSVLFQINLLFVYPRSSFKRTIIQKSIFNKTSIKCISNLESLNEYFTFSSLVLLSGSASGLATCLYESVLPLLPYNSYKLGFLKPVDWVKPNLNFKNFVKLTLYVEFN